MFVPCLLCVGCKWGTSQQPMTPIPLLSPNSIKPTLTNGSINLISSYTLEPYVCKPVLIVNENTIMFFVSFLIWIESISHFDFLITVFWMVSVSVRFVDRTSKRSCVDFLASQ